MRCRDIFREWKKGLHGEALNSSAIIHDEMMNFFHTSLINSLTIYISQSGTLAFTAYSLGIRDYKAADEEWVNYLD